MVTVQAAGGQDVHQPTNLSSAQVRGSRPVPPRLKPAACDWPATDQVSPQQEILNETHMFGALALTGLAACNEPTRPTDPSVTPTTATAAAVEQRFTVRSLGTLGGTSSTAIGINERGEVVGGASLLSGARHAFLWRARQGMRSLGTLGGANSVAADINDRTEVVGFSEVRPGSDVFRAFLWTEARGMRGLGTLGGKNSAVEAINNRREVAGSSQLPNGLFHAVLWAPGRGMRDLGTLGGGNSRAIDVNDATQVVGTSDIGTEQHAFLWTAQRGMEDLGTLGGPSSTAFGISETGEVVGITDTHAGTSEAFLWTRGRGMRSLGTLGDGFFSIAISVNTHRRVVGQSWESDGPGIPFLWTPGRGMQPLPTLGGNFGAADDLNEFGQIVGVTLNARNFDRATLWTPTAGPLAVDPPDEVGAPKVAASPGEGECVSVRKGSNPVAAALASALGGVRPERVGSAAGSVRQRSDSSRGGLPRRHPAKHGGGLSTERAAARRIVVTDLGTLGGSFAAPTTSTIAVRLLVKARPSRGRYMPFCGTGARWWIWVRSAAPTVRRSGSTSAVKWWGRRRLVVASMLSVGRTGRCSI